MLGATVQNIVFSARWRTRFVHTCVQHDSQVKEDEMDEACNTCGQQYKCIQNICWERRPLGIPVLIWDDNIKQILKQLDGGFGLAVCDSLCGPLAVCCEQGMDLRFPKKGSKFFYQLRHKERPDLGSLLSWSLMVALIRKRFLFAHSCRRCVLFLEFRHILRMKAQLSAPLMFEECFCIMRNRSV